MRQPRRKPRRTATLVLLSAILYGLGFAVAAAYLGTGEVVAHLRALSPGTIAVLLALSLANYFARLSRWYVCGRWLGLNVPFADTATIYLAGFAMTTTPGKLGEAVRLWLLRWRHGYRYERTAPLLISDRLGDAAAILLLCVGGLAAFAEYAWAYIAIAGTAASISLLVFRPSLSLWLISGLYGRLRRMPRFFARLRTALRQSARLFEPGIYLLALGLGVAGWFVECLAFHWLLEELGAEVSLQQSVFIFAFAMLVGAATLMPGGLAGTEAAMFTLLASADVDPAVALAATAVIRLTTLWFAVLLGCLALPAALYRPARQDAARISGWSEP